MSPTLSIAILTYKEPTSRTMACWIIFLAVVGHMRQKLAIILKPLLEADGGRWVWINWLFRCSRVHSVSSCPALGDSIMNLTF